MPLNIASASLALPLPANALVRQSIVKVSADSAGAVKLSDLGQVRLQASSAQVNAGGTSATIDFGIPLTVAGAAVPAGTTLRAAYRWRGDSFDLDKPVWTNSTGAASANFPEISTARLQLELSGVVSQATADAVTVQLPSLPADLELRLNNGPVVWRYPGPRGGLEDGWVTTGGGATAVTTKDVDITSAIAPLLGNPNNPAIQTVSVELRARIPGRLALGAGTQSYDLLQIVPVQPDPNLTFDAEGEQNVSLVLPGAASTPLKELWLTVVSAPPKERAVPAVGPTRVTEVELVLDSGRSACVRFPENLLAELTGIRLPLHAQDGTAEVRVQLLSPLGTSPGDEPGPPLEGASATEPVTLEPVTLPRGASVPALLPDDWTLLPFDKPVPLKTAVWISLQVTRGTVKWSLGRFEVGETPYPVRRGAPTGPWLPLPAAVLALPRLGGRLHAVGHPPKETPLSALQLQIAAPSFASPFLDVTPTAKGVALKMLVAGATVLSQQSWLRVISRTSATVTVPSLIRVVAKP